MNRRTILKATAISGVAALLVSMSPPTALATFPGANGRIVFSRVDENGLHQLWTANPDLSAAHQLSHGNANSGWPVWAPDASRIAFDSDRADPDPTDEDFVNDVFTMRPDGSDVRKLTDSVGFSGDPAYSPDGSLIAFDREARFSGVGGVYVMWPDGSGMRLVTTPPLGSTDTEPRFSPDGKKMLFTRYRRGANYTAPPPAGTRSLRRLHGQPGWLRTNSAGHVLGCEGRPGGLVARRQADRVRGCLLPHLRGGGIYSVRADGSGFTAIVNGHGITGIGNENAFHSTATTTLSGRRTKAS